MEELLALILAFMFVFLLIGAVAYVLNGLVYTKLAKKVGVQNWGWAWAPYGSWYIGAKVGQLRDYLWIAPIAMSLIAFSISDLAFLMWVGIIGYIIYNDKNILERFGGNGNLAFLHLVPGVGSIIVFVMIAAIAFGDKMPVEKAKPVEVIPE